RNATSRAMPNSRNRPAPLVVRSRLTPVSARVWRTGEAPPGLTGPAGVDDGGGGVEITGRRSSVGRSSHSPDAVELFVAVEQPDAVEPPLAKARPDETEWSTARPQPEATEVPEATAHPDATESPVAMASPECTEVGSLEPE